MTVETSIKSETEQRMLVLGVPVSITTMSAAVDKIIKWARNGDANTVFVREVASLMLAVEHPPLRELHHSAGLVVPDGMPLVWIGKRRGYTDAIGRVPGADLMDAVCAVSPPLKLRHFLYGGKPGVADRVAAKLRQAYPGIEIVGTYNPPMRDIDREVVFEGVMLEELKLIEEAKADIIWVGISSPKQEYWMSGAVKAAPKGVFIGVGAAFDFHAGDVSRAPRWMQVSGLEWFHRLINEPRRLWKRYLVLAPQFVLLLARDAVARKFSRSK